MNTESVMERTFHPRATESGALVADLAGDSTDLLDLSAALGVELRRVVTELLRAPHEPAPTVVRALATIAPHPRTATPAPSGAPPFVWVQLLDGRRRSSPTVRAGWLDAPAVRVIAAEARASGPETEVHVIVPYDSGDDAVRKVRALCGAFAPDIKLTLDVQGDGTSRDPSAKRTGWWSSSGRASKDSRSGEPGFRAGTWVVLGPVGATS